MIVVFGDAAKVPEGVFQTPDEGLGGLAPDRLAVALARVAEHGAEQMRAAPLTLFNDPSALAKVDLDLFARQALHAPKRRIGVGVEPSHESFDGLVAAGEPVFGGEILIDPLRREPGLASGLDRTAVRLALAPSTRQRPGGQNGWFWFRQPRGAGGRNGWF